jgi:hypothetical protein
MSEQYMPKAWSEMTHIEREQFNRITDLEAQLAAKMEKGISVDAEERKHFEEWFEADSMPLESNWFKRDKDFPERYEYNRTQWAWEGWKAAKGIEDGD